MKRAFAALLLLTGFAGCERYPTGMTPAEQIQALVFTDLVTSELFYRDNAGDDAFRLFLSYDQPRRDASAPVLAYVARAFQSARPYSAGGLSAETGIYSERSTGRPGVLLHIEPFLPPASGVVTVLATTHHEFSSAGYSFRLEQVNGRWKVIDHERDWIACK